MEIAPGIEGLVHISEMSYTRRINKPEEVVSVGETVPVMIREIDAARRRIALSIKEAEGDPWLEIGERFKVGQRLDGTVEKKEAFGLFVNLTPGITGLMPKSKMAQAADAKKLESVRPGDTLQVLIEEIHPTGAESPWLPATPKWPATGTSLLRPRKTGPWALWLKNFRLR